jgi:hypothetical protein
MRAALVKLELWFLDEQKYEFDDLHEINFHIVMNQIKTKKEQYAIDTVVGEMWADGWTYKHTEEWYQFLHRIEKASKNLGIKNFYLCVGQCHGYQQELNKRNLNFTIIDYFWPVQEILNGYRRKNKLNDIKPWNSNTGKFFVPGGVSARPKRIGLLSKFYDAGMLENAEWSFFPPWTNYDKEWCRNYLNRYTDEEYEAFLTYCTRELDDYYKQIYHYSKMDGPMLVRENTFAQSWWSLVGYLDNKIFNTTSISVVNEGPGNDKRFLTEKLWLAIFNQHPFILADSPERYQYCKDLGLKMFNNYLKIKDYGYIDDDKKQIDAIVENTQYFLENVNKNKNRIQEDIEHNKEVFWQCDKHNKKHEKFLKSILVDVDATKYLEDLHLGNYISVPKIKDIPKYEEKNEIL